MPVTSGKEYINRIDKLNSDIWLEGKKVAGPISNQPAFKGVIHSQAKLYDHQMLKEKTDLMTYESPSTGMRVGTSFLEPKTKEDLAKRRLMIQEWAKLTGGMMGRSPEYMNTVLMAFNASAQLFSEQGGNCAENVKKYYEYCRENDLCLTHTFIQPQVDRSKFYAENKDDIIAAKMIDQTKDGIIIQGARLLATQGGITDEIMVFPSGAQLSIDESYAYAFAIPNNTKGLKFFCRESFDYGKAGYDHPLGSKFEEMDTIVVFDNVLVPWERVFLHGDLAIGNSLYAESGFFPHVTHMVVSKQVVKTEFLLGIIQLLVDTINVSEYQHIQEKVAEVIIALETMKSLLAASELNAKIDRWGTMTPDLNPLLSAINYYPRTYPRFSEIIQLIGASGLVSIPTEKDFNSPIHDELRKYLQSSTGDGYDRVKLFRLAWDVSMSAFGSRQTLYERFFFGDPVRLAGTLYHNYDKSNAVERVKRFLKDD
ncbi:4-hydroxyphenylacetate 3-monooxygenase, oxygenase component [Pseudalkalibacillus caeni]|uniref:4-hydroxyphenylacetate 3-monooxygenase, oxygenase component n=1 Tax=Exobacillus caeni TaxID=2574798 RepID=A0A5R9F5B1_9BACL|nr:4-hydroxyphenylacetate 3-monooxygenase, oxygenase component [Pseudalkalibacillus caeni]TLS38221.1 4-hydroxyphenylacetate 3-monooxygenase, oxygenase component [Pseudalkalibacillus caeni]